mmetsp:Transcript_26977/g.93661  ORF Transcript_26977/g.93661 Transcript_26977/m.93661 type:complete len:312 (-) Transcript_26977:214-1149(-)
MSSRDDRCARLRRAGAAMGCRSADYGVWQRSAMSVRPVHRRGSTLGGARRALVAAAALLCAAQLVLLPLAARAGAGEGSADVIDGEGEWNSGNGEDGEDGESNSTIIDSGSGSGSQVKPPTDDDPPLPADDDDFVIISDSGCVCQSDCGNLLGYSYSWCYTSIILSQGKPCGIAGGTGYWDYCTDPRASADDSVVTSLSSSHEVWAYVTACTCIGCAIAYFVAGCMASRILGKWTFLWLPLVFTMLGTIFAFCVGSISAYFLAGVYFSIPYFIDRDVAIGLGVAQAALITYAHLGRGYHMFQAPRRPTQEG